MSDQMPTNDIFEEDETIQEILGSNDDNLEESRPEESKPEEPEESKEEEKSESQQTVRIEVAQPSKRGRPIGSKNKKGKDDVDSADINALIEAFDPSETGVYFGLYRIEPVNWQGKRIEGYLDKFTELITLEDIKERYGGGKYNLVINGPKRDKDGNIKGTKIIRRKVFKISGDPIVHDVDTSKRHEEDPDITKQNLEYSKSMIEQIYGDKQAEKERADDLMKILLSKQDNDGTKEIISVMTNLMSANQQTMKELQENQRRADEKHREEMRLMQEKHEAQMEKIRNESEKASREMVNPFVQLMEKSREDSKISSENMMKMMMEMAKSNIAMITANNENQAKMMQESSSMQINLLTTELQRISGELKEARTNNKGDLASELLKYKKIKDIFDKESGEDNGIAGKLIDRIPDIVDSLPEIASGFNALFSKGTPIAKAPRRRQIPQKIEDNVSQPQVQQAQAEPQPQPQQQPEKTEMQKEQERVARTIIQFKEDAEKAIEVGEDPEKFVSEKIDEKYDKEIISKIASLPASTMIQYLTSQFQDEETLIATVNGRDFLRRVHAILKEKY